MACCHFTFMQVSVNFVQTVLTVDTLMHQMELPFSVEDLLHVYTIVRSKRQEPPSPLPQGNHYLHLRHSNQPQTRLVTGTLDKDLFGDKFVWILGNWEFWVEDDGDRSRGTTVVYLIVSISFVESVLFMLYEFFLCWC